MSEELKALKCPFCNSKLLISKEPVNNQYVLYIEKRDCSSKCERSLQLKREVEAWNKRA